MKKILVSDLVSMPKKKKKISVTTFSLEWKHGHKSGFNSALKEISNLPVDEEKLLGMVELDEEKIRDVLRYAMQVKISASGTYVMAEIEEKQLEVKISDLTFACVMRVRK